MNRFTKKCDQCGEFRQNKNIMTIPRRKETMISTGRVDYFPEMHFCKEHEEDWYLAYDGMSYEEMPERPETVYL